MQRYVRSLMFLFLTMAGVAAAQEGIVVNLTGSTGAAPGEYPEYGNLIQASDGNFYGLTQVGGANGYGAAFKVSPAGVYTLLHSFSIATTDGAIPEGGLIQGLDGNFYGTTNAGGANDYGTIFEISATAPYTFTLMHSFSSGSDGIAPQSSLVQGTDGNFYGVASAGGTTTYGTIYKITPTAPYTFTLMHNFVLGATDGQYPYAPLVQGTDGNFYGTTNEGGAYIANYGGGTVFKISPTSPYPLTLLYSFANTPDGYAPYTPLIQGADGYFYGVTLEGGANGQGSVFKINPASPGAITLMYSFLYVGTDGQKPKGGLVLGTDGKLYGTTYQGGGYENGTMFSIGATSPYTYTQLHIFTYDSTTDGAQPYDGLLQGADGNFYGTTYYGGSGGIMAGGYDGTIFKYVPATPLAGPVALTVPASVVGGASYTLGYSVANAYSATLKQCFATNTGGDTTWTGTYTASATNTNATLTAPATAGSYTYTLTCGGMESGFATLVVTAPPTTPAVMLTPTTITFPNETVNNSSAATTITLSNPGTATLNIAGISLMGNGAADFAIINNTCGNTLAVSATCTLGVTFKPAGPNSYSATVSFNDNGAASPQTVMISGTGIAAAPTNAQLQFFPAAVNLFAGIGVGCNDAGDSGPALSAALCNVTSAAVDKAGNTYIVDQAYNTVRKVDTNGNISTFAGVPVHAGFNQSSGDGGQATAAYLDVPNDVAVDPNGNVYIVESYASRIREVNATTGIITTFVGGASGNFHGGTGAAVALGEPIGIAFDPSGNLYIGTFGQFVVIKVTPAGVATALAGTGTAGYNGDGIQATTAQLTNPLYVASDLSGNIYIEDGNSNTMGNCRIRKVTPATGLISTVAGTGVCGTTGDGGAATSAQIYTAYGPVAVDPAGDVFFNTVGTTGTGSTVRKVDIHGNINTVIGGGATQPANYPVSATATYVNGILSTHLDNNGNLLLPISTTASSNYADLVVSAGTAGILQFGSQTVLSTSAPMTVTLEDSGANSLSLSQTTYTASGDFAVTGGTCVGLTTLASGASCTLTVTFTPTTTGPRVGSITVLSNSSAGSQTIILQGTGTPGASTLTSTFLPATLTFSTAAGTTSAAQASTFMNTGNTAIAFSGVTLGGSGFATTNNCPATLAVGASCMVSVTFSPTQAITYTGSVTVNSNSTSASVATLSGTGTTPPAPIASLSPSSLMYSSTTINTTSASQLVTLSNTGNASLSITSYVASAGFSVSATTCGTTLAAGNNCTYSIVFTPTATGPAMGTFTVTDNSATSTQTISLTGTGAAVPVAIASLTPPALAFGNINVNSSSASQLATLSNTGNASLSITSYAASAGFTVSATTCGATLGAGMSCTYSVVFAPTTTGPASGTFSVTDSATGSPQMSTLSGTGVGQTDFSITAPTPAVQVSNGSAAQFTINVVALSGSYTSPVVMSVTGLPTGATATFTPATVTPGSTGATTVLSVQTPSLLARSDTSEPTLWFAVLLLPLLATRRLRKKLAGMPLPLRALLLCALGLGALLPLAGCGGGFFGPTAHTSTLTVTGTSGAVQHSTTVTLTVQ